MNQLFTLYHMLEIQETGPRKARYQSLSRIRLMISFFFSPNQAISLPVLSPKGEFQEKALRAVLGNKFCV